MTLHSTIISDTASAPNTPEAPAVSVLIAAYGQEKYLSEALESLQRQIHSDWEAIIVDDGSPDGVADIARRFAASDSRINFFHTGNHGVSAARNFAAQKARGEYVVCLDADDLFLPEYLAKCLATFANNPEAKVVYAEWKFFGDNTHTPSLGYTNFRSELLNNAIHVSAMMRRTDFLATGGFDCGMRTAMEDWEFWIRALRNVRPDQIILIKEPLFLYRQKVRSRNNSGIIDYERYEKLQRYIFEKHRDTYLSIIGRNASADMLMFLNPEMYDLVFNTQAMAEQHGLPHVLKTGIRSARRLSRNRNVRSEISLHYISLIAARIKQFYTLATQLLEGSKLRSYRLLTSNPRKFMRRSRLTQALMPKNWGKPPSRYL